MCKYRVLCTTSRRTQPRHCSYLINLWPDKGMQRQVTWSLIFYFLRFIFGFCTINKFDPILCMNWLYFRCRTEGELDGDDGENSMYFDMPVNLTTCHCIGPVHSDNNDNQGPLGGKYIEDIDKRTFVLLNAGLQIMWYALIFIHQRIAAGRWMHRKDGMYKLSRIRPGGKQLLPKWWVSSDYALQGLASILLHITNV